MAGGEPEIRIERVVDGSAGRWYEEFEPGTRYRHAVTRTITETDNSWFSLMTMNSQPLHIDTTYAAKSEFGRPVVNSLFTLAVVVGLSVGDLTLRTTVANLGFDSVSFPAPVLAGDTIRAETDVLAKRVSRSRPEQGIVTLKHRGFKQDGAVVCRAIRNALIKREGREDGA
jgi:acyl dehydratase